MVLTIFRPGTARALAAVARVRQPGAVSARPLFTRAAHLPASRGWKSSAVRWLLAVGLVYYYNTSPVFAEEPPYSPPLLAPASAAADYKTVDQHLEERRHRRGGSSTAKPAERPQGTARASATPQGTARASTTPQDTAQPSPAPPTALLATAGLDDQSDDQSDGQSNDQSSNSSYALSPDVIDEADTAETADEAAFDPETGEINWDCPCLGGMAHGPCGDEFKAAFSCFVHSQEDPKGMECVDNFRNMQDCFRLHPDVYGSELALEDGEDDGQGDGDGNGDQHGHGIGDEHGANEEPVEAPVVAQPVTPVSGGAPAPVEAASPRTAPADDGPAPEENTRPSAPRA